MVDDLISGRLDVLEFVLRQGRGASGQCAGMRGQQRFVAGELVQLHARVRDEQQEEAGGRGRLRQCRIQEPMDGDHARSLPATGSRRDDFTRGGTKHFDFTIAHTESDVRTIGGELRADDVVVRRETGGKVARRLRTERHEAVE